MRVCFAALFLLSLFCIGCKKTGPQGATGATGPTGAPGPVGPAGNNGSVIYSGTTAPGASVGNVGDFYMDLATSTLYGPKTSSGWGSGFSLKGDTGATGAQGDSGANGATGTTGATGANGKAGTQIYAGTGVPAPTLGVTGDFYMDTVAHNLYGPKQTAGWGTPIALQGPAGANGANGATGATGPQGPAGPAGTANVLYTPWIQPSSYASVTGYGGQIIVEHTETIPAITAAIVQGGTVICYAQLNDYVDQIWPEGQVGELPITLMFKFNSVQITDTWEMTIATGSSTIEMYDSNNEFNQYSFSAAKFRWVIIPGGSSVPGSVPRQQQVSHGNAFQ